MKKILERRRSASAEDGHPVLTHLQFNNAYTFSEDSSSVPPSPAKTPTEAADQSTKAVTSGFLADHVQIPTPDHTPPVSPTARLRKPPVPTLASEAAAIKLQSVEHTRRIRFRNLSSKSQSSILDQKSSRTSVFFGFFTLFWVIVAIMVFRLFVYNYFQKSVLLDTNIISILLTDLWKVALTDLLLYCMTYFAYFWQAGIRAGYLDWHRSGWIVQHVWQAFSLFFVLWFNRYMDFTWIGCVFLLLHQLVLLMKEHSYAFYNGYLWQVYDDLSDAKEELAKIRRKQSVRHRDIATDDMPDGPLANELDGSLDPKIADEDDSNSCDEPSTQEVIDIIKFSEQELEMQSTYTPFPENITFANYFAYSMFPTLIYQIEYPRTDCIRWNYVFDKVAATFGVFFLMVVVSENYLYPIAMRAVALREVSMYEKLEGFIFVFLDLIPPFALIYLLTFYIIWDAILNAIAELTYFGDREFYGEWWNCVTWDQFAKDWNVPVHRFLLRHVYHSSISCFHLSKYSATIFTFLLSSCVHELVMFVIFKKLRGYLFCLQMGQLPLVALSRTRFLRGKQVLGNVIFWIGIVTGPSIMCSLYLTF